ncbi:hypothetical protein DRW07_07580 [Alteromonas sediminis]|uniref:Uncharacterized protein n=1 Tax=Alteromonas sediminis TaxID=2259342 RepID=A0A3N5Y0W5_9ALTE|nr:hypothetical protein [Alteromonas sediminis]RPJ67377.1 hypothetical protein DRW07_07580 [Alteromonas sediminis]
MSDVPCLTLLLVCETQQQRYSESLKQAMARVERTDMQLMISCILPTSLDEVLQANGDVQTVVL